jgi:hypothetical protein
MGDQLVSFTAPSLYIESRSYGTIIGGRIDDLTLEPKTLFEGREPADWLDGASPPLACWTRRSQTVLRNGDTGGELEIGPDSGMGRVADNLLVWAPKEHPKTATLYDPGRWTPLATWNVE